MEQITAVLGDQIKSGFGAIDAGQRTQTETDALVTAVQKHLVTVDANQPCACIDGRPCLHTASDTPTTLRPKIAGGVASAYVAAELAGWPIEGDDLAERFEVVNEALLTAGIPTGNHADERGYNANFASGKTGCGANDRLAENVAHIYEQADAVSGLVATLLGDRFSGAAMQFAPETRNTLAHWRPTIITDSLNERDPSSLEILANDDTPTSGHREELVVFNFIQNTTVDRDALVAETGRQVFVVDMWFIDGMARALAGGLHATEQSQKLLHALVAFQIGTYLTLCNGSQRTLLLRPLER